MPKEWSSVGTSVHYRSMRANGIDFTYLEVGDGPLVLCFHGFPDRAETFAPILEVLAAQGFRAVAPYMRGYAPSGLAPDGDYSIKALALDVVALIDHFGVEQADIVGHDWGAAAAYSAANLRPDRIRRLVTAAVPHLRRFLLRPTWAQLARSSYMAAFQRPWAEKRFMRNDFAALEQRIASWSPGWPLTDQDWWLALKGGFSEPMRMSAALGYYRALPKLFVDPELWRLATAPIVVPTRIICGARDGCIGAEMFLGQEHLFTSGVDIVRLDAGHFMHQEQPSAFAEALIDFLKPREAALPPA